MEEIMNKLSLTALAVLVFTIALGWVGSYDYADDVVYNMPEHVYYTILDTLGDDCSNKAVAAEYMKNREYYDNLKY